VDVRTESEFSAGHIQGLSSPSLLLLPPPPNLIDHLGARHCSIVPPWSFQSRLTALGLDPEKLTIAICLTAHRSISAQKMLTKMGFQAKQLKGGMKAWRHVNLPEVTSTNVEQKAGEKEEAVDEGQSKEKEQKKDANEKERPRE